jgi:NDP-sugar pyrophosphorylase family protein
MKAMILAAGLGTRLRPLTDDRPKALVELGGRTLLEITITRLRDFGVREIIVNVHHLADKVVDYLQANGNFGIRIEVSREDLLLDTGGGLKKAAWFFLEKGTDEPFLLHNVDVLSNFDLGRMIEFHNKEKAVATLAVQKRESSRQLLFNEQSELCGRRIENAEAEISRAASGYQELAFCGVHVISPRLLSMIEEDGVFSIIPSYLRLAGRNEKIVAFRADEYCWRDLGRLEDLERAEADVRQKQL